jgi:hypothetical protein
MSIRRFEELQEQAQHCCSFSHVNNNFMILQHLKTVASSGLEIGSHESDFFLQI